MRGRSFRPKPVRIGFISRSQAVRRTAQALSRLAWPRFEMMLIVGVTGLVGFLASVVLLGLGVEQMASRYPLAVGTAYVAFLIQLWAWMHIRDSGPDVDIPDFSGRGGGGSAESGIGGGGDFGGGGASGSWEAQEFAPLEVPGAPDGVLDVAADGEGCVGAVIVVALVAVAGGLVFAAINLVWTAPVLMAELLVDGALSYGLYRNLRSQEREFWLFTALRRTGLVFACVALLLLLVGAVLERRYPGTHSFGEAMRSSQTEAVK